MPRHTSRDRVAAFRAAARAWEASQPHRALEILEARGFKEHWPEFRRLALQRARERFLAVMPR